jgi:hypothetical protein
MITEKLISDVLASSRSLSQKGDVSQHLLEQGFFDEKTMPRSLKERDKFLSGGNPVDVLKEFTKQNPN